MRLSLFLAIAFLSAAPSMADWNTGFDSVYRNCFEYDNWNEKDVTFEAPDEMHTDRWYSPLAEAAKIVPTGAQAVETVFNLFRSDDRGRNATQQFELMAMYIKTRAAKLPKDEWTDFRKSCLVLCASSHYLKYERRMKTKLGGLGTLVQEKHGECTEFSNFAHHLAGKAGIRSHVVLANQHAFLRFYIPSERRWFYAEPQSESCNFYDPRL
jgi:hypothetical protein